MDFHIRPSIYSMLRVIILMSLAIAGEARERSEDAIDVRDKTVMSYILFELATALHEKQTGETVQLVVADSAPLINDMAKWCVLSGNKLRKTVRDSGCVHMYIAKAARPARRGTSMTIILSRKGLDDLLMPLSLAISSATTGMHVTIFFQGAAVKVLERGFKERLSGLNAIFSGIARRNLKKKGHLPVQEKMRQLLSLGVRLYACGSSMDRFGVEEQDMAFPDVVRGEDVTILDRALKADIRLQFP
jgi:predicted peroxiredoxin